MTPGTSRWLAPVGASAAVLAVFLVPGVVAATGTSRAGVGPQQPRPVLTPNDPVTPPLPDQARQKRSGPPLVDVVGYRVNGRDLVVFYTVDQSAGCSGAIEKPLVQERGDSVRILLLRRKIAGTNEVCVNRIPTSSVDITLSRPLGGRLLRDAARDGALVPPIASLP